MMGVSGSQNVRKIVTGRRAKSRKQIRDYYLERKYPSYGNLSPREFVARRKGSL